nr:PREDICTED: apolipoprotein C-I, acidic form-like [Equus przewalskii]
MRLVLSLPVLLVALWMVCEGRAPAQVDLEPDQDDLEPDGVIDVIWGGLKKVGKCLGKKIVKHIIHDINKKNGASATWKMASKTMKDIPDTVDRIPPPHRTSHVPSTPHPQ